LKFLLDVHISNRIAWTLRQSGHDVARIVDIDREMHDHQILSLAADEGRVLITEDSDFSELIFARDMPPPPALIYIRCRPFEQPGISDAVLDAVGSPQIMGHAAVITTENIRYRPFPKAKTS
jgi:predicted nuclease of predicted toxin-antitoxin system